MASSSAHARVRWRCGTCAVRSAQYVLLSVASVFIDTAGFAATLVFVVTHGLSGWITSAVVVLFVAEMIFKVWPPAGVAARRRGEQGLMRAPARPVHGVARVAGVVHHPRTAAAA